MAKVRAADQIGTSGLAMISVIAMQEDACGYKRAVSFWNEPLMLDLGIKSRNTFNRVRETCVENGWLKYKSGGTRKVGYYYVSIPDEFLEEKDSAIEERLSSNFDTNVGLMQDKCDTNTGLMRDQSGSNVGQMRDQCGTVSTLYPIPNPIPIPNPSKSDSAAKAAETKLFNSEFKEMWSYLSSLPNNKNFDTAQKQYATCRRAGFTHDEIKKYYWEQHCKNVSDKKYIKQFKMAVTIGNLKAWKETIVTEMILPEEKKKDAWDRIIEKLENMPEEAFEK